MCLYVCHWSCVMSKIAGVPKVTVGMDGKSVRENMKKRT